MKLIPPKAPLVSVVIPTFNSSIFIERCLRSVFKTDYPDYEVIVVDDCSGDDTLDVIKSIFSDEIKKGRLRVYRNRRRLLAAASRNKGFHKTKGEFVALLDHDVEVHPDWLAEMVKEARKDEKIGIVQSKVFDINKRDCLQCVGVRIQPELGWVESIGCGETDNGQYDSLQGIVGGATGVLYRKSAFKKVGGFDERLGINLDDLDLNWRFWIAGYKTVLAPKAITYHWSKEQKTRDKWLKRFLWEFHYAKMPRVFLKNYSLVNLARYLPIYLVISSIRAFFNIFFRLNFAPILGLIYAHIWNMVYLSDTLGHRKHIQKKLRRYSDEELTKNGIFLKNSVLSFFKNYWLGIVKVGGLLSTKGIISELLACPVCAEKLSYNLQELPISFKSSYKRCKSCGLGILYPLLTEKKIKKTYDSKDYFESLSKPVGNSLYQWFLTRKVYLTPSEWMIKNFRKGKILDVGCGNGEFLYNLKGKGWDVYGSDISNIARRNTESKIGVGKVKTGVFYKQNYPSGFDYVSFWHILEHLRDPYLYTKKAYNILKKGGRIVGEVPNFDSIWLRLFKGYYCWIIIPEHLLYFSKESLITILKKAGFHSIEVFTPPRGLLNLSFSLKRFLKEKKVSDFFAKPIFVLSLPTSIILTLFLSFLQKGEVLRFSARK